MRHLLSSCIIPLLVVTASAADNGFQELTGAILDKPETSVRKGAYRQLVAEAVSTEKIVPAINFFASFIHSRYNGEKRRRLNEREFEIQANAADACVFLSLARQSAESSSQYRKVLQWICSSKSRYQLFLNTIEPTDDWSRALQILDELYRHDPEQRDEYFRLILALALVWDQPNRPPLHHQMGGHQLPYKPQTPRRYDYFKQLYDANRAEIPYRKLSATALTFVVDTPVPITELEWVRENEPPRGWEKKYTGIAYVTSRLHRKTYQWPGADYSLANIKATGGICVDQAYYAVLCARAWGMPAFLFSGPGRRGPHAWFGYMKDSDEWEMDIGRYTYDKYATGRAVNPQNNQYMTDHYVEFICNRALRYDRYRHAARYGRLAFVLKTMNFPAPAQQAARRSLDNAPLYEYSWHLQEEILKEKKQFSELYDLLENKAQVFRKYPDFIALIRKQQADILRRQGEDEKADRLLSRNTRKIERGRDDLTRFLANEKIQAAYEAKNYPEARELFEDMLKEQKQEGRKIFSLMGEYLELTNKTDQQEEAAKFLKRYVQTLQRIYAKTGENQRLFLNILLKAYKNAGDQRNIEKTQKKLKKLK